ncbi:hypothetical protein GA0061098_103117 [Bradyrhizobium shewense]|uniref:Uncharacterized protein n=1 Tax=Bradyrhizobium shewense TaxID=1761772 RepID=A0A1C3XRG8_9BRAD|nr:hypothetical protein GA0061098_103117 [Bradyrhizobium shewense]
MIQVLSQQKIHRRVNLAMGLKFGPSQTSVVLIGWGNRWNGTFTTSAAGDR